MYFGLGLLAAGLLALLVTPAIWRRAMRLARARIEAAVPLTRAEINAEKDHLRAGFAVANRRLEVDIGRLNDKLAGQVLEVDRRRGEITSLNRRQAELTGNIAGLEARVGELAGALGAAEAKLSAAHAELLLRDERIAEHAAALADMQSRLVNSEQLGEEQRLELVARATTIANLNDRLSEAGAAEVTGISDRDRLVAEIAAERQRVAAERQRTEGLEASLAALRSERSEHLAELARSADELTALKSAVAGRPVGAGAGADGERERHAAELDALNATLAAERQARQALSTDMKTLEAERGRVVADLARRREEVATLNAELFAHTRRHQALERQVDEAEAALVEAKAEMASMAIKGEAGTIGDGDNLNKALAATETEKQALAERLAALEEAHAALSAENTELRRVAGAEWESDRQQNERLRERLNEIATNVVRLTQTMATRYPSLVASDDTKGSAPQPASPDGQPATEQPAAGPRGEPGQRAEGGTLVERLRALQQIGGVRH